MPDSSETSSNLFEAFNFRYFGPVDGHDVVRLTKILDDLKDIPGPKLLHVITVKGKGYKKAEQEQTVYHAPGAFDKSTGEIKEDKCVGQPPKYQTVFGRTIVELAELNPKIVGVTPAMSSGCSLNIMANKIPDRVFDVGIAEQHAVTFSAGLAASGHIPFCNIYSSFLQRAYDQIIHDVALQKLPVIFFLDRAGLVGEDGATHHGVFDLAYLRIIPNMIVAAPLNEQELRDMMFTAQSGLTGPMAIRYPRGRGVMPHWKTPFNRMEIGKGKRLRKGESIAVVSIGHVGNYAIQALDQLANENIHLSHYDIRFLKPLDDELLHDIFKHHLKILTVEEGVISGGLGSALLEFKEDHGYVAEVKRLGIPDRFIEQGTIKELHHECGIDVEGIIATLRGMIGR